MDLEVFSDKATCSKAEVDGEYWMIWQGFAVNMSYFPGEMVEIVPDCAFLNFRVVPSVHNLRTRSCSQKTSKNIHFGNI